jgi:Flp pilus assembly protein TadG
MPSADALALPTRRRAAARGDRRGSVAVEFAAVLPVLALLVTGAYDIVTLARAQLRLEAAAVQLGQIVSQCTAITSTGDTDRFWSYAQSILGRTGTVTGSGATGAVIVSAVFQSGGVNRVAWQRRTGVTSFTSSVGTAGGTATIAAGFVVPLGQTLLVTEIFVPRQAYVLSERLMGGTMPRTLRGITLFLSRAPDPVTLQAAPTTSTATSCTA